MANPAPNLLLIMADQMAASALPVYGRELVKAPNIATLAADGVVFDNAYCNFPLCAPSRFSMLSGQLPSRIDAYDNAAEFASSIPTLAHYLRTMGYHTCLGGKMHFIGADQLHGYEERLTSDIYPADFGWTPSWDDPAGQYSWYHNMLSVVEAGVYARTIQLDFDEEVAFQGVQKIYDLGRKRDGQPFFLTLSFTQPHDPYMTTQTYWDYYDHTAIDLPSVAPIPLDQQDPHSRRILELCRSDQYHITLEHVRNARHAYYGMISYIDDQVGKVLMALREAQLAENTVIIITADHGEMLGERGMWYKMNFFEPAARVPFIVFAPNRFKPRRVAKNMSLIDLLPTVLALAAGQRKAPEPIVPIDGHSLVPLLTGDESNWPDVVFGEYLAEGTTAPCFMVKQGRYKYIHCTTDAAQLFDLDDDPQELNNLAGQAAYGSVERSLTEMLGRWDTEAITTSVVQSQRRRLFTFQSLMKGRVTPWDFQPHRDASKQYTRNHETIDDADRRARIPYLPAPKPDVPGR